MARARSSATGKNSPWFRPAARRPEPSPARADMRFLGIGDYCDLSALYLRLLAEGHEVKVHIAKPLCRDTLAGLVVHIDDWRNELAWLREAGDEGIALFENAAEQRGTLQDQLRRDGYYV